jgi:hypothetical protein
MYRSSEIFVDSSEQYKSLMQYNSMLVTRSFEIVTLECMWRVGWPRLVHYIHQIYRGTYDKPYSHAHINTLELELSAHCALQKIQV